MRSLLVVLGFGLALAAVGGCKRPTQLTVSDLHSDSGVRFRKADGSVGSYADLMAVVADSVKDDMGARIRQFGTTPGGLPQQVVEIGSLTEREGPRQAVIITGAIHGDEYLNVEDRLPAELLKVARVAGSGANRYFAKGGIVFVVPIMNPDGFDRHIRGSTAAPDLNRDFPLKGVHPGPTQPETRQFLEFVNQEVSNPKRPLKLELTMDYHCCANALLFPWGYQDNAVIRVPEDLQAHVGVGEVAAKHLGKSNSPNRFEYGRAIQTVQYSAKGMSYDHFYGERGALGFVYEGEKDIEPARLQDHVKMWDELLGRIADGAHRPQKAVPVAPQPAPVKPQPVVVQPPPPVPVAVKPPPVQPPPETGPPFPAGKYMANTDIRALKLYCRLPGFPQEQQIFDLAIQTGEERGDMANRGRIWVRFGLLDRVTHGLPPWRTMTTDHAQHAVYSRTRPFSAEDLGRIIGFAYIGAPAPWRFDSVNSCRSRP